MNTREDNAVRASQTSARRPLLFAVTGLVMWTAGFGLLYVGLTLVSIFLVPIVLLSLLLALLGSLLLVPLARRRQDTRNALALVVIAVVVALPAAFAVPRALPGDFSDFGTAIHCDTPECRNANLTRLLQSAEDTDYEAYAGNLDSDVFACIGEQYLWGMRTYVCTELYGMMNCRALLVSRIDEEGDSWHVTMRAHTIFGIPYETWVIDCPSGDVLSRCIHRPFGDRRCAFPVGCGDAQHALTNGVVRSSR